MQTFDPAASKQEFIKAAVNFWTLFNQMCHVGKIKLRFSEIQSIKNMNVICTVFVWLLLYSASRKTLVHNTGFLFAALFTVLKAR